MAEQGVYADLLRQVMRGTQNRLGHPVTIRMLASKVGVSYEHIRKIIVGLPVVSRPLSDSISEFLGLDPDQMWALAETDKIRHRLSDAEALSPFPDQTLQADWKLLTLQEHKAVIKIIEAIATPRRQRRKNRGV